MKTNRTKRSVFFCRAAALIALAAVCMIGCQNATDGSDGNSNGGGNTPQSAVEKYVVVFNADTSHVGALTAKVDGKEIHSGDRVEQGKIVEFTTQPESGKRADTWFIEGGGFETGSGTAGSDTAKVRVLNNISVRVSFKDVEAGKHIVRFGIEGSAGESRLIAAVAGGSAILSGNEVSDGSVVEFTARPESGKTVDRWFIEGGNFEAGSGTAGSDTAKVKVSGNINVRVVFKDADPNKHIVTFGIEGNAGESAVTAKVAGEAIASGNEVNDGAFVEFTAVPAPGYKVKSWTIVKTEDNNPSLFEEGGTGGSLRAKARAACNLTVKVEFERIIYTIMFGFEGSSDQGTFTAQKDGADFVSGGNAFYGEELTFSAQLKAGWKITTWTIVKTDDSSPLTFEEGGAEGSLSAKAKVTCNITVKVKFEKIICTVSFTVPGGHGSLKAKAEGAAFVSVSPIEVEYGKTVEFTASPAAGYKVKAWTVDGNTVTADSTYSLTIVQDINLTVTFTEDNVRITIRGDERVDEGGYIDIPKGKTWGAVKTQVQAKCALKREWKGGDYGLYRWAVDNENGNTLVDSYTFTEDTVVYAVTNYLRFRMSGTELTGYDGAKPRGRIIIDDGVTKIKAGAFNDCTGLTGKLKLPAKLTEIEDRDYYKRGVFQDCTGLQGVDFSACTALTKIGSDAFFRCTGLTGELKLPASLTEIGDGAFYSCTGLTGELKLPASLTMIEGTNDYHKKGAFESCTGLQRVDFSACTALTKIGWYAFRGCMGLTGELKLPANLTEIGAAAFSRCTGLTGELKLPASLTEIGDGAFYSCTGLTGILKLPANLKVIDRGVLLGGAFCKCTGITGLDFSACKKLTEIGDYAFSGCTGLRGGLELPASLTEIGNAAFSGCMGLTGELKLPVNLTILGSQSFEGCKGLEEINFSACSALTKIGGSAFSGCTGLTGKLKLPASLTEIGDAAFSGCMGLAGELKLPASLIEIGESVFSGCTGLTGELKLPASLTVIGAGAFYSCTGLTGNIVFPANLKEIKDGEDSPWHKKNGAFEGCTGITGVNFSSCSTLTEIGKLAFRGCSKLTSIILPSCLTAIKEGAFDGCRNLASSVTLPPSLTSIGCCAFSSCKHLEIVFSTRFPAIEAGAFSDTFLKMLDLSACTACTEADIKSFKGYRIETIKLPSNFTAISRQPFKDFSELWKLSLDFSACTGITTIADRAFDYCNNIKGIKLPPNITTIGDWSFYNCKALERIDASGCISLTSIGENAFSSCKRLSSVDLSACTVLSDIGESAFSYCENLTSVNFPVNLRNIKRNAFADCENLTSVDLSACTSLTEISYSAFADCTKAEVMLPENITSIVYGAFGGALEYGRIRSYCKKVKIKGGTQFNRIKALVIASEYPESMIVSY